MGGFNEDFGSTPEKLRDTLRTSVMRSRIEDRPPPQPRRAPVKRWLPRYWLTRLYLVSSLLTSLATVLLSPGPLHHALAETGTGTWLAACVALLCLAGLADVVVNDLLPAPCAARWLRDHRHLVFNGIALGLLGMGYAVVRARGWSPDLITYLADVAVAVALAPLDLLARHREG